MRVVLLVVWLAPLVKAGVSGEVHLRPGPPATSEERAYFAAARSFQSGHWATAARWLDDFAREFPESRHRPNAVLLRGQALFQLGEYNRAAGEISRGESAAGDLADDYLYWKAECRLRLGQHDAAGAHLQELLREHPASNHALAASVALATVSARKNDWAGVVQLLRPTESRFQLLAKKTPHSPWAQEGRLLLAQALFEQQDWNTAAEELAHLPASTELQREWRRLFLLAKLENQAGKPGDALLTTERIAELARQTGRTNQLAQVHQFRAAIHEQASDIPAALKEYARLQSAPMPPVQRQEGFLRAARLQFQQGNISEAINALDALGSLNAATNLVGALDCMVGELELLSHRHGNAGALQRAEARFKRAAQSGNGAIQGRAKWGEGWCHRLKGEAQPAWDAWSRAIELLEGSPLAPWARMHLAQTLFQSGQHTVARSVLGDEMPVPLRDFANHLALQSALAMGDYPTADLLHETLKPNNPALADAGLLAMAQARLDAGEWARARLVFARLMQQDSPLKPEADLEAIRELTAQKNWRGAIAAYSDWLGKHTQHPLRAQAMFDQAWALSMAGQSTNALAAYKAVVEQHPNTAQSHMAEMWQADFWFNAGTNRLAEATYKSLSSRTNAPIALRYRASLMAGRAAMARQGLDDARREFSKLINDEGAPVQVRSEATFALGDLTVLEMGAAVPGAIERLTQATNAFYAVVQVNPTNRVAARAWGRIGDCCLLAAGAQPGYQEHARLAYQQALAVPGQVPVAVKSQARVGLAKVLARQARGSADREQKLAEAVDHLLAVVHGKNLQPSEVPDAHWRAQASLMAMDLLGELGKPREALELCNLTITIFPAMKTGLEKRKEGFLDQLSREK